MARALRREAIYAQWDTLGIGRRVTLPDIEDIGAYLGDPRWTAWAARIEVKRLADAPRAGYRRWRTTVRLSMPGWFADLFAVYVDALPAFAAATNARKARADELAAEAEVLRGSGQTIEATAEAIERVPSTIVRYRRRARSDTGIS
jgi:hypothetical protein